ncbi:MAG: glucose-1-phosphate cytidylyltransferase [Leptolyngbyaceae cyanobacterium CRU_2_3]|nr:glucose-1-phosphate cytidylyltransferase [Leptolyngbyaceae cyanobacterium CRU_2_3]
MKVVLFCGGLGTRLREHSETIPKPLVEIGYRPIIWHLMRYYAHFGHKEFILCLGYKADYIKNYFLNYNECLSNNFTLSHGGKHVHLHTNDIEDWEITFVDTGLNSNIGQRLMAVKPYLDQEEVFLANYADGLSDLNLDTYLNHFYTQDKVASFLAVQPSQTFHVVSWNEDTLVESIQPVGSSGLWINGGFFAFKQAIFDYIQDKEELVLEPFQRLIQKQELVAYKNAGFWACMDTFKEKTMFDEMYAKGNTPWTIWESFQKF